MDVKWCKAARKLSRKLMKTLQPLKLFERILQNLRLSITRWPSPVGSCSWGNQPIASWLTSPADIIGISGYRRLSQFIIHFMMFAYFCHQSLPPMNTTRPKEHCLNFDSGVSFRGVYHGIPTVHRNSPSPLTTIDRNHHEITILTGEVPMISPLNQHVPSW